MSFNIENTFVIYFGGIHAFIVISVHLETLMGGQKRYFLIGLSKWIVSPL